MPGASLATASKSLIINNSALQILFSLLISLRLAPKRTGKYTMNGKQETSEESQASAEIEKEHPSTLVWDVGFLYLFKIVSLFFSSSPFSGSLRLRFKSF